MLNENELDKLDKDQVLIEWSNLKNKISSLKEEEMEFRKYIVKRAFPNAEEGTNKQDLGNGYKLKAVVKYNYKLEENNKVSDGLNKIASIGNQGKFIAERLVSWTPNFLITEYRTLQEEAESGSIEAKEILKVVTSFLTITDAAPSLEIVEPKAKK